MEIRSVTGEDYKNFIVPLWRSWNSDAPSKDFLPDVGMIVLHKETPVCAGYLYVTNSSVAWLEWICTNKNYTNRKNRKLCITLLLETLIKLCKDCGYKYIFAVVKSEPLMKHYEEVGFTKAVQGFEMIKKL